MIVMEHTVLAREAMIGVYSCTMRHRLYRPHGHTTPSCGITTESKIVWNAVCTYLLGSQLHCVNHVIKLNVLLTVISRPDIFGRVLSNASSSGQRGRLIVGFGPVFYPEKLLSKYGVHVFFF